jgi:hypothetical protein
MNTTAYLLAGAMLVSPLVGAGDVHGFKGSSDWQQRRLFEPLPAELVEEARGRIVIYDGMQDVDVERALDEEFDRVETMMFIRIKATDPQGEVVAYEDDGC